jgi:signal transduction histidine kinase
VAQSVRNPPTPQFIQNEARLRAGGKVPESERQPLDRFREITVVPGLQQGLLAEVVRTRAPTDVANANTTMADFYQRIGWEPVPSAYVCPMVFEDQCEGLIYVDKTFGKDRLTEWDRQVLQIAAVSLAGTAREHRLSRELRDQILSLSHSGITPYATIHACAQELDSRVQGKIERQMLTLIQSEARRGEEVIRRLLRYQQATTVGIVANVQEVDILALIKERVRPYLAILEVRGIRFDLSMPQSPLLVQADPDLLGLALAELATNAFLAVQNSPLPMSARFITVRASIGAEGHKCLVTVGNCGDPIPSTTRGLLFEPFVSGRGSTGLGLWIAREMARKQQGDVWYDERAACPTFVLAFPIAEQKKGEGAQ